MRRVRHATWILAAAGAAFAQDYPTPSFDCANAETQVERRICRVQELSELDGKHGHLAALAIRGASDHERARSDVEAWLRNVRDECASDECLVKAYAARNAELERIVAKQPPPKPLPAWVGAAPETPKLPAPTQAIAPPSSIAPSPEPSPPAPSTRVNSYEPPDDSDDEEDVEGNDWWRYAAIAAFAAFALVLWRVIARSGQR